MKPTTVVPNLTPRETEDETKTPEEVPNTQQPPKHPIITPKQLECPVPLALSLDRSLLTPPLSEVN